MDLVHFSTCINGGYGNDQGNWDADENGFVTDPGRTNKITIPGNSGKVTLFVHKYSCRQERVPTLFADNASSNYKIYSLTASGEDLPSNVINNIYEDENTIVVDGGDWTR